jgi:hypothetical protein
MLAFVCMSECRGEGLGMLALLQQRCSFQAVLESSSIFVGLAALVQLPTSISRSSQAGQASQNV